MPKQKQIDRKADIVGDKLYSNANIYLDRKYLKFAALHK